MQELMENNVQVFSNPVFGNIRTMMIDGAPWFVGKEVADILGYANTQKAIRDHVDEEDRLTERIVLSGQNREVVLINESGLYGLILSSKMPAAKRFKHWVTSEVLPTIRKTGSYNVPAPMTPIEQLQLQATAILQVNEKVDNLDKKIDRLELDLPILGIEIDRITSAAKKKGVECLGGKNSEAYADRSLRGKVYNDIYRELKRRFGVTTYKAIKRNQCDLAISIIEGYRLPYVLLEQVQFKNSQIGLWGGGSEL